MLYLVKSYSAIKIGSTNNIKTRMRDYKTHNPDFELLDIADGTEIEEKILHSKLKDFKYKNSKEWFIDCEEVRNEWNNYVKSTGKKYSQYDIEICKPYSIFITNYEIKCFGIDTLYNEPLYNIITGKQYKNVMEWLELENKSINQIIELFIDTDKCPFQFINSSKIKCHFGYEKPYPTMDYVYKNCPFNIEKYQNKLNYYKEKNNKNKELMRKRLEKCPEWILNKLDPNKNYFYEEIEKIFSPLFKEHGLVWNKNTSMRMYFPTFIKTQKTINKIKHKIYKFNIF